MTKENRITTIGKWKGKPAEELSKKELLEVVKFLSDELVEEKDDSGVTTGFVVGDI